MRSASSRNVGTMAGLVAVGAVFGSAFLCVKVLVEEMTPAQVVAGRLALGGLAVVLVLVARRRVPRLSREILVSGTVLAFADGVIPYVLVSQGQTRVDSGIAAVLISTMPIFTALFAAATSAGEPLNVDRLAGLAIGLAGVVLLVGADGGVFTAASTGSLMVIGGSVSYAGAAVYARRALTLTDPVTLTCLKLAIGAAVTAPIVLMVDGAPSAGQLDAKVVLAFVALGVVSTGLARVGYFAIVARAGSVQASLVAYIVPLVAVTLGWIVLGETMSLGAIVGSALIVAGVVLVMFGTSRLRAPVAPFVRRRTMAA